MIFAYLTLGFLIPAIICYLNNYHYIGTFFYLFLSLVLLFTNYFSVKNLRIPKKDGAIIWCPSINLLTLFYLGIFYFLIGYFGNYLPEFFSNADKIFHMIYNDISKNLILSIMAAIIFSFTYDYQMFVKKYYLFLDLENKLIGLWSYILFVSNRDKYKASDFIKNPSLRAQVSATLNPNIYLSENEINNIRIGIDRISNLLSNNFIDSLLNQKIHYLITNLEFALNFTIKNGDKEYHNFARYILEFNSVLSTLNKTKEKPFLTLILNR